MGKSTISMAIFNSKLLVYQRVSLKKILRLQTLLAPCRAMSNMLGCKKSRGTFQHKIQTRDCKKEAMGGLWIEPLSRCLSHPRDLTISTPSIHNAPDRCLRCAATSEVESVLGRRCESSLGELRPTPFAAPEAAVELLGKCPKKNMYKALIRQNIHKKSGVVE